jgi:hypothetical protein
LTLSSRWLTLAFRSSTMEVELTNAGGRYQVGSVDSASEQERVVTDFFQPTEGSAGSAFPPSWYPMNDFPFTVTDAVNGRDNMDPFFAILLQHEPAMPLDAFFDTNHLTAAVSQLWRTYWVQFVSLNQRVPIDTPLPTTDALITQARTRIAVDRISAAATEAILAIIFVITAYLSIKLRRAAELPKAPYTLGAQLGFLAGSKMTRLHALRGVQAQRMNDDQMRRALTGFRLTLGWSWSPSGRRRFGIDFVTTDEEILHEQKKTRR